MSSESEDILKEFHKDLSTLRDNDKYKINALTFRARDYKDNVGVPEGIVEATTQHIYKIPAKMKLIGLYVIDSIVKNVATPYRKLYTKNIVDVFVHSFEASRVENVRMSLFKLRNTWTDIFPKDKMHELDLKVRVHDQAWPLVAAQLKHEQKPVPRVPKKKVTISEDTVISVKEDCLNVVPVSKVVNAPSRDPRIIRKRKSSPEIIDNNFLIDRDGDKMMESVAREQGKQEAIKPVTKKPKSLDLFSGKDQDMRPNGPSPSPARSNIWSNYANKHSEICVPREFQDVDMRLVSSSTPHGTGPNSLSTVSIPTGQHLNATIPLTSSVDFPRIASTESSHAHHLPPFNRPPPLRLPTPHLMPHTPDTSNIELPQFSRPQPVARCVPPIRGPIWSVEIDGLPEMINIGVDPRMLSLVPHPKPSRHITVDGRQYPLLLSRVQPMLQVEDELHAVRFRRNYLTFLIDNTRFDIPGTGYIKICVAGKERTVYLGGPGHELVIDGKPHTIPFDSHLTSINVDGQTVSIKCAGSFPQELNVLPAIPPRILDWAGRGLFGPPSSLHIAPLNPLAEMARKETNQSAPPQPPQHKQLKQLTHENKQPAAPSVSVPEAKKATLKEPAPLLVMDVDVLLKQLIAKGMISRPAIEVLPDLKNYSWEKFKVPFTKETDSLYSGYQCVQCGVRFENEKSPEFAEHLDYHYVKNSAEQQARRSRAYYQSSHYWLISEMSREGVPQFKTHIDTEVEEEPKCLSFSDESLNVCAVCYEKFDIFFDRDEGEWMLRGALLVGNKLYHPICQEDVGKHFTADPKSTLKLENENSPTGQMSDDQNVPPTPPYLSKPSTPTLLPIPPSSSSTSNDKVAAESPPTNVSMNPEQIDTDNDFNSEKWVSSSLHTPQRTASLPLLTALVSLKEEELPVCPLPSLVSSIKNEKDQSIPGFSPQRHSSESDSLDTVVEEEEEKDIKVTEGKISTGYPSSEGGSIDISSDPIEALKAVLRGGNSLLSSR